MISPDAKRRSVYILFAVAILLLALNLFLHKLLPKTNPEREALILSGLEINNRFLQAVNNFGLEEDWIVVRKLSNKPDSLFSYYTIKLPPDLPIPVLISWAVKSIAKDLEHFSDWEQGKAPESSSGAGVDKYSVSKPE